MTDFFAEKVKRASEVKFKIFFKNIFLKCKKVKRATKKKNPRKTPSVLASGQHTLSDHELQSASTIVILHHTFCNIRINDS
jgi:hypothetical protein